MASTTEVFVTAGSGGLDQPQYLTFTPAHQVTITPNTPPTITSPTNPNIDENLTDVQTLTAIDPETGSRSRTQSRAVLTKHDSRSTASDQLVLPRGT